MKETYTKTMPSRLNMSLNPLLNMLNILLTIFQILVHILRVAIQQIDFRRTTGVNWHRPGSVLDAGCQVARKSVGFGGCEIHVFGAGRRVVSVEGVHGLDLASVCFHTASCLTLKGVNDVPLSRR
jgi:hypothetical protein